MYIGQALLGRIAMGVATKYWFLVGIDSFGNCRTQQLDETLAFFVSQFPEVADSVDVPHRDIQYLLMQWYQEDDSRHHMALSCLRCFISNQIKEICEQLEAKFGKTHDFTSAELLPLVLDSIQKSPRQESNGTNTNEQSLITRILKTFDPEKSNLSSWTSRMFKSDRLVKRFLLERGIEQVTDWMILSYTNSARLERVLSGFDRTKIEIDSACQLLNYYHQIYSTQLAEHRQIGSRNRYPDPTVEQLCQIANLYKGTRTISPEKVLEELQNLAKLLRKARIPGKLPLSSSVETYEDSEQSEFLGEYRQQFDACLAQSVNQVIQTRVLHLQAKKTEKALEKAKKYLKALHLFHCHGVSMKEIASQLEFTDQPHLSRFLELKNLRSDIGHNTLMCLHAGVVKLAQFYLDADQLRDLELKVQALLDEQINTVIKEAEKEASTGHNRVRNGRLARSICQYLNTKKEVL